MIKKVGIVVKYNGLTYLIGEGFGNIFKNKKSTITSIITMVCMMFLFGLFFAIGVNVNYALEQVQMKQGMNVFIWDETTEEQKSQVRNNIGVNLTDYVKKTNLSNVATSGSYNDLTNKPTILSESDVNNLIDTKIGDINSFLETIINGN